jgi:hypothetical protein
MSFWAAEKENAKRPSGPAGGLPPRLFLLRTRTAYLPPVLRPSSDHAMQRGQADLSPKQLEFEACCYPVMSYLRSKLRSCKPQMVAR